MTINFDESISAALGGTLSHFDQRACWVVRKTVSGNVDLLEEM